MKITDSQVLHVANLARLKLDPDEVKRFQKDLNSILEYMGLLAEVDTAGTEPMHHPFPSANVFRSDVPVCGLSLEQALMNAPETDDGYVTVPRVIE